MTPQYGSSRYVRTMVIGVVGTCGNIERVPDGTLEGEYLRTGGYAVCRFVLTNESVRERLTSYLPSSLLSFSHPSPSSSPYRIFLSYPAKSDSSFEPCVLSQEHHTLHISTNGCLRNLEHTEFCRSNENPSHRPFHSVCLKHDI